MKLMEIEIAQRVDGKFNIWANVDYCELMSEKRETPVDIKKWVIINVFPSSKTAIEYCCQQNLNFKLIPKKYN